MPIIIFEVTEDDYVLFFELESFKLFRQKVPPYVAYFYQVILDKKVFIHELKQANSIFYSMFKSVENNSLRF